MTHEIVLTQEMVDGVRREIRTGGIRFWPGELEHTTLEVFINRFDLPWKGRKGFKTPDFTDPRVQGLQEQLRAFPDNPVGSSRKIRIPNPGLEVGFTEATYANSIPDFETLAAIGGSHKDGGPFVFVGLVDTQGEKATIFGSYDNLSLAQRALRKEDPKFQKGKWSYGRVSLTDSGKLEWVFLDEDWGDDGEKTENVRLLLAKINPRLFSSMEGWVTVMDSGYQTLYRYNVSTAELQQISESPRSSTLVGNVPPLY